MGIIEQICFIRKKKLGGNWFGLSYYDFDDFICLPYSKYIYKNGL